MNDRLKFRTPLYENGKFIKFAYWGYNVNQANFCTPITDDDFYDKKPDEQCTGLKDKNGKLIYEGDVVNYDYNPKDKSAWKINKALVVEYGETGFKFTGLLNSYFCSVPGMYMPNCMKLCTITGTIHDGETNQKGE